MAGEGGGGGRGLGGRGLGGRGLGGGGLGSGGGGGQGGGAPLKNVLLLQEGVTNWGLEVRMSYLGRVVGGSRKRW